MAKFLFCVPPRYGHVNPDLAIAEELVAQGAEVVFYCTEEYAGLIQPAGVTFKPYKSTITDNPLAQNFSFLESSDPTINECFYVLPQLLDQAREEQADCLVYDDFCLWGRILAQVLQMPAALILSSYARNDKFSHFDYVNKITNGAFPPLVSTADMRESLLRLCNKYGVEPFEYEDIFYHAEPLNIVRMTRAFHPLSETFDEQYFKFVGPIIRPGSAPSDFPLDKLSEQPVLYASLGTVFNGVAGIFDIFLSAFGNQPQQLVLALGESIDPHVFGPLPENVILHPHVPQLEVLQHTDLFITHGGLNSVMEALSYGIPLVVIPQAAEQPATGYRLQELKLGLALPHSAITVHMLRTVISMIKNDPDFKANAVRMQQEFQSAGGAQEAAQEILLYTSKVIVNK